MIVFIPGTLDNIFKKVNRNTGEIKEVLQIIQVNDRGEKEYVNINTDGSNGYASQMGDDVQVKCRVGVMVLDNGKPLQTIKAI